MWRKLGERLQPLLFVAIVFLLSKIISAVTGMYEYPSFFVSFLLSVWFIDKYLKDDD